MTCKSCRTHPPAIGDVFCAECRQDMSRWLDAQYRWMTGFSSDYGRRDGRQAPTAREN